MTQKVAKFLIVFLISSFTWTLFEFVPQNRSDEEIEAYRKSSNISIMRGQNIVPKPILKFEEAGFPLEIMKILENTDFSAPMP